MSVTVCQKQRSYSGLPSPGRLYSTYLLNKKILVFVVFVFVICFCFFLFCFFFLSFFFLRAGRLQFYFLYGRKGSVARFRKATMMELIPFSNQQNIITLKQVFYPKPSKKRLSLYGTVQIRMMVKKKAQTNRIMLSHKSVVSN